MKEEAYMNDSAMKNLNNASVLKENDNKIQEKCSSRVVDSKTDELMSS